VKLYKVIYLFQIKLIASSKIFLTVDNVQSCKKFFLNFIYRYDLHRTLQTFNKMVKIQL